MQQLRWALAATLLIAACATVQGAPPPDCDGTLIDGKRRCLSGADIMTVAMDHKTEVKACAVQQQAERQWSRGTVLMRWRVLPSGEPVDIEVAEEGVKESAIGRCMKEVIARWTFPEHVEQGEPIRFPVRF